MLKPEDALRRNVKSLTLQIPDINLLLLNAGTSSPHNAANSLTVNSGAITPGAISPGPISSRMNSISVGQAVISKPSNKLAVYGATQRGILGLCGLLILIGIALFTIGYLLHQNLSRFSPSLQPPQLWHLAITPAIIGVTGIGATINSRKFLILSWVIFTILVSCGSYIFFTLCGYFEPASYNVTIYIFDACLLIDDMTCQCRWSSSNNHFSTSSALDYCHAARRVTVLYLTIVCLLVACFTTVITCCVMACVVTCCMDGCSGEKSTVRANQQQQNNIFSDASRKDAFTPIMSPSTSYYAQTYLTNQPEPSVIK